MLHLMNVMIRVSEGVAIRWFNGRSNMQRALEVVADKLGLEEKHFTKESRFIGDLGADSLDRVELVMALEDEYNIEICDEDADKILTINDMLSYLKERGVPTKALTFLEEKTRVISTEHFDQNESSGNAATKYIVTFSSPVNCNWLRKALDKALEQA